MKHGFQKLLIYFPLCHVFWVYFIFVSCYKMIRVIKVTWTWLIIGLRRQEVCVVSNGMPNAVKSRVNIMWQYWKDWVFFFLFTAKSMAYGSSWAGVKSELQLQAYTTATATLDPSHICNLCCSSQQCQILNPLSEAKIESKSSQRQRPVESLTHWSTRGTTEKTLKGT